MKEYWLSAGDKLLNNIINMTNPSWPQLILIFGIIFTFLFRKNITGLLRNVKKISRNEIEFYSQTTPTLSVSDELGKTKTTFNHLTTLKTITANQEAINTYLQKEKITDPQQISKFLINELADLYFVLRCERVYFIIFGSQIQLLKKLLASHSTGLTQNDIDEHFAKANQAYPDLFSTWNSNLYMNFLLQTNMIIITNNIYWITDFGADFLTWLQRAGYNENKLF